MSLIIGAVLGLFIVSHGVTLLGGILIGALARLGDPDPQFGVFGRKPTHDPAERWAQNFAESRFATPQEPKP